MCDWVQLGGHRPMSGVGLKMIYMHTRNTSDSLKHSSFPNENMIRGLIPLQTKKRRGVTPPPAPRPPPSLTHDL